MDFALTEEQELLLESVDELMERYGTEQYFKECDEKHEWPTEFTDALLENGFQMLGVDEKFGGTPVDVTTLMLVSERICKNGAPIYVYGNLCALKDMTEYGSPEQHDASALIVVIVGIRHLVFLIFRILIQIRAPSFYSGKRQKYRSICGGNILSYPKSFDKNRRRTSGKFSVNFRFLYSCFRRQDLL